MKKTYAPMGSVSHGTMRVEDLMPTFMTFLEGMGRGNTRLFARLRRNMGWPRYLESGDADTDLYEVLWPMMEDMAPPFCYFGPHPGDGADFGYWMDEDWYRGVVSAVKLEDLMACSKYDPQWWSDCAKENVSPVLVVATTPASNMAKATLYAPIITWEKVWEAETPVSSKPRSKSKPKPKPKKKGDTP